MPRTINTDHATVNIHEGYCSDSIQTEQTVSRIVSEYYVRRMREKRQSNHWNDSKLDVNVLGRL